MSDLEVRLVELGGRLDHPEGADLLARVRAELDGRPAAPAVSRPPHRRVVRRVLALAAAVAVIAAISLPASRTAIADLFRVDGVDIRATHDRPHAPATTTTLPALGSIAAAQRRADFTVRVPRTDGTPRVSVDAEVPGGLVTLDYPEYRVVEFAAPPDGAVVAKFVDPRTHVARTAVGGADGYWITGTHHEIAYLDRDNRIRTATMHTTGHVLTWATGGVTYRIEGPETLARAQAIAASIT